MTTSANHANTIDHTDHADPGSPPRVVRVVVCPKAPRRLPALPRYTMYGRAQMTSLDHADTQSVRDTYALIYRQSHFARELFPRTPQQHADLPKRCPNAPRKPKPMHTPQQPAGPALRCPGAPRKQTRTLRTRPSDLMDITE